MFFHSQCQTDVISIVGFTSSLSLFSPIYYLLNDVYVFFIRKVICYACLSCHFSCNLFEYDSISISQLTRKDILFSFSIDFFLYPSRRRLVFFSMDEYQNDRFDNNNILLSFIIHNLCYSLISFVETQPIGSTNEFIWH